MQEGVDGAFACALAAGLALRARAPMQLPLAALTALATLRCLLADARTDTTAAARRRRPCAEQGALLGALTPVILLAALALHNRAALLDVYCVALCLTAAHLVVPPASAAAVVALLVVSAAAAASHAAGAGYALRAQLPASLVVSVFIVAHVLNRSALVAERSFTAGEAATVAQGGAVLLVDACLTTLCATDRALGPLCVVRHESVVIAEIALVGSMLLAGGVIPLAHRLLSLRHSVAYYGSLACGAPLLMQWMGTATRLGGATGATTWLLWQAASSWRLFVYWASLLAIGCSAAWRVAGSSGADPADQRRFLDARKVFHLVAFALFAPAAILELRLLQLALAAAASLFALLEAARAYGVWPLAAPLRLGCARFIDSRDGGALVLTHQYLLLGCGLPVLLFDTYPPSDAAGVGDDTWRGGERRLHGASLPSVALPLAGILVLGVGDAMASSIGTRFGSVRWPRGGGKTLEGSAAAWASMLLVVGLVHAAVRTEPPAVKDWLRVGAATAAASALEALTHQIDNLFLPPVFLAVLLLLSPGDGT